jgi:hypothetical protein
MTMPYEVAPEEWRNQQISFKVDPSLKQRISEAHIRWGQHQQTDTTLSSFIRSLIRAGLDALEAK